MSRPVTKKRMHEYTEKWKRRGYDSGIPDEVPSELMRECLAPSYRAIAVAILSNDLQLHSLGFSPRRSAWYGELKRIEIASRVPATPSTTSAAGSTQLAFNYSITRTGEGR